MKKTIIFVAWCIFVIVLILFSEFLVIAIKNNEFNEYFTMIISTISIFATFGGAYLGAKISGDNAKRMENMKRKREKEDVIRSVKVLFKLNLDYISDIHIFICQYYFINRTQFLKKIVENRMVLFDKNYQPKINNTGNLATILFVEKFMCYPANKMSWSKDLHKEIEKINVLIEEMNQHLIHFEEKQLNIMFQLKQVLQLLSNYIEHQKNSNYYIMPRKSSELENVKGLLMLFSILYIDLNREILDMEI
ncbi:hypothetical protein RJB87_02620 [Staphylococcus hominis]|uniref:hypothetical protein n=1 Tax=Staphylococcus hominis TaxID=1290 RepID=UPI0028793874|nr:hypothetical protein [Staphylococcus hominis]MDS3904148.1 hypothetical protein [Staphylococcus hominis]